MHLNKSIMMPSLFGQFKIAKVNDSVFITAVRVALNLVNNPSEKGGN